MLKRPRSSAMIRCSHTIRSRCCREVGSSYGFPSALQCVIAVACPRASADRSQPQVCSRLHVGGSYSPRRHWGCCRCAPGAVMLERLSRVTALLSPASDPPTETGGQSSGGSSVRSAPAPGRSGFRRVQWGLPCWSCWPPSSGAVLQPQTFLRQFRLFRSGVFLDERP